MTDYTSLTEKNPRHSSVANLQVTNVRVDIILSKKRPERKSWPTFVFVVSLLFSLSGSTRQRWKITEISGDSGV